MQLLLKRTVERAAQLGEPRLKMMSIFERVRGIEPLSTGWKPVVIAIIRHPHSIQLGRDAAINLELLLQSITTHWDSDKVDERVIARNVVQKPENMRYTDVYEY